MEKEQIEQLLASSLTADDESLYYMMGKSDLDGQLGISPESIEKIVLHGKKLFQECNDKIRMTICSDKFLSKISDIEKDNKKTIALAVAEAISVLNGWPFAIFASVIIVRCGYYEYCKSHI